MNPIIVKLADDDVINGAVLFVVTLDAADTPIKIISPVLPVGTVMLTVVAVMDAPGCEVGVPTNAIAIDYIVTVWVTVSWSPAAESVAVADNNVSCNIIPVAPVSVSNVPIFATVTGDPTSPDCAV